ncbi:hypothetical protein FKW77_007226 [Venturia effusa]|uniref:Uncharacterized protein n=1 Tax=Venturia effusa TaxID=50376 RepID=A0A517LHQ2_9PEZI|nr:hypothetical protein FKW77_007226 [Venturia effusa]
MEGLIFSPTQILQPPPPLQHEFLPATKQIDSIMEIALVMLLTFALLSVIAVISHRFNSPFGRPREQGLLHQLPFELRQEILARAAPWDPRPTYAQPGKNEQSYVPLRVRTRKWLLPFSRLYQAAETLPTKLPLLYLRDFQPPIKYKSAFKPLLMVNRQTRLDMLATIVSTKLHDIRYNIVPSGLLTVDYVHNGDNDTVEAAWWQLSLPAHAIPRLDLVIVVFIPWNATLRTLYENKFPFLYRSALSRVVRSIADIIARIIHHGPHLENPTPLETPITIETLRVEESGDKRISEALPFRSKAM